MVKAIGIGLVLWVSLACIPRAEAFGRNYHLKKTGERLAGLLVDHTANHGCDRRIYSPALGQKKDLYVYLPPGFDPHLRYPLMIWLHGLTGDEREFVEKALATIDKGIACGKLPPLIIALPDGSKKGHCGLFSAHSVFLNSRLGNFEDYLECDVWNFVNTHYPIHPDREAHVIAGVSLGGGAAYNHAIKWRHRYATVIGIFPPLNVRWMNCNGRYFANFDPDNWGWRTSVRWGHETVGRFYGFVRVPLRRLIYPIYGRGPDAIAKISRNNPIEMLDYYNVQPGELNMLVAYGGRDEFNMDAQIESFLYRARQKGLPVAVLYDPIGRHNTRTAESFFPAVSQYLAAQIAPYSPPMLVNW